MADQNNTDIQQFFDALSTYVTVIRQNYMHHAEVIQWIKSRLTDRANGDLKVLEAGCGDAHVIAQLALDLGVRNYTGIDLAGNALQTARSNLAPVVPELTLIHGHILEQLANLTQSYDLILAGYVLHHLEAHAKAQVLKSFKALLATNGSCIVYDVTSRDDETREAYLHRTLDHYDTHWKALSSAQLQEIREHVMQYDFPESVASWQALAANTGLRCIATSALDEQGFFGIMQFVHADHRTAD